MQLVRPCKGFANIFSDQIRFRRHPCTPATSPGGADASEAPARRYLPSLETHLCWSVASPSVLGDSLAQAKAHGRGQGWPGSHPDQSAAGP